MAKILIVDDDFNNRLLLVTLLKHAAHVVVEASDGAEGLRLAQEHHPDLVIVDLNMPTMDGVTFIRTLRSSFASAEMRIALYTGTAENAALRDFMELAGVAHVIPKPCEPEELSRHVELALRG
jgi:CheY-like chemotaxis protein